MSEDFSQLRSLVRALARRERRLSAGRIVLRLGLLLAVVGILAILATVLRWDRASAVATLVLVAGAGGWMAVVPPWLRSRKSANLVAQARRVEAMLPELRGRLITAVERLDGAQGQESAAMVALIARRATRIASGLPAASVYPLRGLARIAAVAGVAWLAVVPLLGATPGGPRAVYDWWASGMTAHAAVESHAVTVEEEVARVGDLVIRYLYPSYTGLEPKEVPNSTGDVRGPPGTVVQVRARSGEPVEAAGLLAYDERLDVRVDDAGRDLQGQFSIRAESGHYKLLLYRQGESVRSRRFEVEVDEDLAPEVTLDAEADMVQVAADESFGVQWRARDDYGVRRVSVVLDGHETTKVVYQQVERRAEVSEMLRISPADLGLQSGDRAQLGIVAWDNDTFSGSKPGYSRTIEVVVLGARGRDLRVAERQEELMRLMLPILARGLTEPWPAGDTSGELADWGEEVGHRFKPLFDAVERLWRGMSFDSHDADVMDRVVRTGRELIRYTQVAFTPGSAEDPPDAAFTVTAELRDGAIVALEDGILAMQRMRYNRGLRDVVERASNLDDAATMLSEQLASEDLDAQEVLARLDQLQALLQQLMEAASKMGNDGLREFVNSRNGEVQNLMEQIRDAIANGDMETARTLMERLAEQIHEMKQGVSDELERRTQQSESGQESADELMDELERLENEQRDLQSQVRALRESTDQASVKRSTELWERIEEESAALETEAGAYLDGLVEAERRFYEKQRAEQGVDDARSLHEAISARDLRGAKKKAYDAAYTWDMVYNSAQAEQSRRMQPPAGPRVEDVAAVRVRLARIQALLRQLESQQRQMDPSDRERAEQIEQQQRDLENQLQRATQEAEQLARESPVRPEGMSEALDEAGDRMSDAGEELGGGRAMEAEGSQGVAAERIRDARESLRRAMEQAQQQASQMQPSDGQQGQQPRDDGKGDGMNNLGELEIPTREEFRTPEEYRRALLEGMAGEVPDEYRALKKRYYEELVRQ